LRLRSFRLPQTPLTRRWWIKTLVINAGIMLLVFGVIQLIPVRRDNPPVRLEPNWDSPTTRQLAEQACFDCHSNETEWPWYARIAPSSWIIRYDVTEGREALNFSEWDRFAPPDTEPDEPFAQKPLAERIADEIHSGRMPPGDYRLMNPDARLSDDQKAELIEGLQRTIEQSQQSD
jgi:hypothetical protein